MVMRNAAIYSGVMHLGILTALVLGLPSFIEPLNETIVPFDIVTPEDLEAEKAKPKPEPPPEPKAEEKAPEPEPEEQKAEVEPEPAPPKPEPAPAPEPEAKPEPEPEPVPEPKAKVEEKAEPLPEPKAKPTPPVPTRRPEVKMAKPEKKEKPKPDQLTSILRNVEKLKDQPKPATEDKAAKAPEQGQARPQVSAFEQNEMIQAIQQQLRACWRLDPGAREAEDLIVEIRVMLNPDGSVRQAQILDGVRMGRDAYFRSAAENAKRAIDVCSPFKLPLRKYDIWRELTLRFNPREMFGT